MLYKGIYKIADVVIEINSIYEEVHLLCQNYACNDNPELVIQISKEDIEFEEEINKKQLTVTQENDFEFSSPYLETLAVYRKLATLLLDYDILLFHGSVVVVNNVGYLFTAKSGIGKTTHSKLWVENIPGAYILNGDKPLLKIKDDSIIAYGTPWQGKEDFGINSKIKLSSISLIERSENNRVNKVDQDFILPVLIQQSYMPNDSDKLIKTMKLIDLMIKSIDFFDIQCNMDKESALLAYEVIQKKHNNYSEML